MGEARAPPPPHPWLRYWTLGRLETDSFNFFLQGLFVLKYADLSSHRLLISRLETDSFVFFFSSRFIFLEYANSSNQRNFFLLGYSR